MMYGSRGRDLVRQQDHDDHNIARKAHQSMQGVEAWSTLTAACVDRQVLVSV